MGMRLGGWLVCASWVITIGCQTSQLPTYPALNEAAALDILARRAAAIHTLTAQCELTLVSADRQTVELEGVLVMSPPDRLRLRVWKLDQIVFDLTLLPDGLWIETSPEAQRHGPVMPAAMSAAQLAHFLIWFEGGFFAEPGLKTLPTETATLKFGRDLGDGTSILCEVDRDTVTARKFSLIDATGRVRFCLALSDYRDISGIIWPTRLRALTVNPGDGGSKIDIVLSDVEFNQELAPQAFVPPAGAEKRP